MYDYCLFEQESYFEYDRFLYGSIIAFVCTIYFVVQVFNYNNQLNVPIINEMSDFIYHLDEKPIDESYIESNILSNKFKMYVYDKMK